MPQEFGAWSTVDNRFRPWRDAGVFEALLDGLIAEAATRGEIDLSLVSIDSTTARAHHDAVGMSVDDLSELDLSYTPPLGSPWDAVQIAAQAWMNEHHLDVQRRMLGTS
jgi:hypothetical protein